uniref:Phosphoribosylformylglycinamidine synthase n=2 Tax=Triatoma infestans TaxID=30076 RepID=A0A170Z574_TRIIF
MTIEAALDRVLRHPSVCSKRFLTNKVDRCVTGLIAQQQCVGPLHTPIADFAITALSMYNTVGTVTSIGEQPIKGLLCPKAGARMSVAEAISNLVFAKISTLKDVKCSGNWMWAAKLEGEGAKLFRACEAMCDIMIKLGIAIDGGKDSLSMAARVGRETVKSPGTLVISAYAPCPDIRRKVTPDFKGPIRGELSVIIWVHLSSKFRLGGSIIAQTFSQLGDEVPDIEDALALSHAFNITQEFILDGSILSGHDVSDGGMITTLIEMAIGGISGFQVQLPVDEKECHGMLFGEEAGWLLEIKAEHAERFMSACLKKGVSVLNLGQPAGFGMKSLATIRAKHGSLVLMSTVGKLYKLWEETSYKLECRQANYRCVTEEFSGLENRTGPKYKLTFDPDNITRQQQTFTKNPVVAIIREEGTNGDREMVTSVQMAGFDVWDVTMQDLLNGTITADYFTGIVFPGGFSYADVMGSAKGWAGCLKFHNKLRDQFEMFRTRRDTFSLGVCNGCQLMSLLGWVGRIFKDNAAEQGVFLDHNLSERFECRFSTVLVDDSRSIMTQGMKGSWLGVWVAHGEGRFTYRNDKILNSLEQNKCISFRYIDDNGHPTEVYPMNPNGSIGGVAGICSEDGRHLAMMPHPERCTLMWQWPYVPANMQHVKVSPWMKLFHNAYQWCLQNTN